MLLLGSYMFNLIRRKLNPLSSKIKLDIILQYSTMYKNYISADIIRDNLDT